MAQDTTIAVAGGTLADAGQRPVRYASLDGLRGVAAAVVVIFHALLLTPTFSAVVFDGRVDGVGWLYSPLHIVVAGTEAVTVFFVLSGFVLATPVVRSARFAWRAYFPARLVRLYLPVAAGLVWAVCLALLVPLSSVESSRSFWLRSHADALSPSSLINNLILVRGTTWLNSPLWSLRWEVIFSILLPVYVLVARRSRRIWPVVLAATLVAEAAATTLEILAVRYLLMFAVGVLLAVNIDRVVDLLSSINRAPTRRLWWAVFTIIAVLLLTSTWTLESDSAHLGGTWTSALVLLGASMVVVAALGSADLTSILTWSPIHWLGRVSFSLYLVHEPIVVAVGALLPSSLLLLALPISLVVSLLVAAGFFRLVETPTHRLAKIIRRRLAATPALRP